MNAILEKVREYLNGLSSRERWLLVVGACVVAFFGVQFMIIDRLEASALRAEADASLLESQRTQAIRLAGDVLALKGGLRAVEARIKPGERTNLLALLEQLATQSSISKEQLESIKPKQPGRNPKYPETGVEVRLKSVSLEQMTRFLHKIETADSHLIIRSLGIRAHRKQGDTQVLDIKFSVSSFSKA